MKRSLMMSMGSARGVTPSVASAASLGTCETLRLRIAARARRTLGSPKNALL